MPKSLDERMVEEERNETLYKAVGSLPEIQRRRFLLYYEYEFNFYQIAAMEHCTASAIQKSVAIAKEKVKAEIEEKYTELVQGIHEMSYLSMLRSNLSYFQVQDNLKITFDRELKIVEGDGKGEVIRGTLDAYQICLPQVQPKSLFANFHNWFFS